MKYLKRFNESNKVYMSDIEDILLEVSDIGFEAGLTYDSRGNYADPSFQEINGVEKEVIRVHIEHNPSFDDYSESFQFNDIKECLERLIDYMGRLGYRDFIYIDLYTEFNFDSKRNNIELDNLRRELDYYLSYEPDDEESIVKIENRIQSITETSPDSKPNILPKDEEMVGVIRLTFFK